MTEKKLVVQMKSDQIIIPVQTLTPAVTVVIAPNELHNSTISIEETESQRVQLHGFTECGRDDKVIRNYRTTSCSSSVPW